MLKMGTGKVSPSMSGVEGDILGESVAALQVMPVTLQASFLLPYLLYTNIISVEHNSSNNIIYSL